MRKYWQPMPTTWKWVKTAFRNGNYKDAINIGLAKIPNHLWPLGLANYIKLWEKHGSMHPGILAWRSLFHAFGGAIAGLPLALIGIPTIVLSVLMAGVMLTIELKKNEGTLFKQLIDTASWTAGITVIGYLL